MLLSDLSVPDPVFDTISFAILHAFRSAIHYHTEVDVLHCLVVHSLSSHGLL